MIKAVILFDPSRKCLHLVNEDSEQEAKLLYYYPSESTDAFDRRTQASLLEGVFGFAKFVSHSEEKRMEMETDNLRFIVVEIEKSIFLSLVFPISENKSEFIFDQFCSLLFLLHGSVLSLIEAEHLEILDDFVPSFISAGTPGMVGIRYAPIERHAFISVYSLGLELQSELDGISDFAIMYDGCLIASSMEPERFQPLYSYLVMDQRGSVKNDKLSTPPYGRIGTPATLPGGGSSSFGRSNAVGKGFFLFGPTGQGECVFCPIVHIPHEGFLCVYIQEGLMFVFILNSVSNFNFFRRIENFLRDNNEINFDILPMLKKDLANGAGKTSNWFFNSVNKSLMIEETVVQRTGWWYSKPVVVSNTPLPSLPPLVDELAVKRSSNEGWIMLRKRNEREIRVQLNDYKMPLWKANEAMSNHMGKKFSSVYL